MTDQITVPRATWDALISALENHPGNYKLTTLEAKVYQTILARAEVLTAANAVSQPKPETAPATEGGAITSESAANAVQPTCKDGLQVETKQERYVRLCPDIECGREKRCTRMIGLSCMSRADIADSANAVEQRCQLCKYEHGHSIGCENNRVDISLAANAVSAPQAKAPKWVDVQQRTATAQAVYAAIRKEAPGLGPWSAFDADEAQRIVDAIAHPQATEPACKQPLQVPEGYKLVPVELTPEMCDAARWSEYGEETSRQYEVSNEFIQSAWTSLLAAAPEAKQ